MSKDKNSHPPYIQSFFTVPFHILNLPGMTLGYLKVYEVIFGFWYNKQLCYIGAKAIGERTNLGKTQVYEAINYFIANGEIIKNGKYFIQPNRVLELETDVQNDSKFPLQRKKFPVERKKVSGGAEYNNNKLNNINNIKASSSSDDDANKKSFDQFWAMYPRKVGKQAAWKAWKGKKAIHHETAIFEDIIHRQNNEWKDKPKEYIPHPSTYLNGERWNDEKLPQSREKNHVRKSTQQAEAFDRTLDKINDEPLSSNNSSEPSTSSTSGCSEATFPKISSGIW